MLVGRQLDLLRLHRPSKFSELIGQGFAIDRARDLRQSGGAAVFHGPSGVGKTALARLLAQAFLCDHAEADGSPCGRCPPCRGVHGGTLTGSYVYLNGPDDGRVEPVGHAIAVAAEGRPFVMVIDNAEQLSSQTLLMLQRVVDERRTTTLIVLIMSDVDAVLAREPWMLWRYDWIAFPPVSDADIKEYLKQIASAHGISISDSKLEWCSSAALGSVALALRYLEGVASLTDACVPEPVASVAEGIVRELVAGARLVDVDGVLSKHNAEKVRREMEQQFGACLNAIRQGSSATGLTATLVTLCESAGKQHQVTARALAEALVGIWRPTASVYSNPAFIRALSRTETLLSNGRDEDREQATLRRPPARIRSASNAIPGRFLNAEQCRALATYCATATRCYGLTVRLEAHIVHDNDAEPAKRLSTITHGLSMFMASRQAPPPGWFYLNRQRAGARETILAVLTDRAQVDAAAKWLDLRIGKGGALRTCRETADDRRIAFQVSVLRETLSALDPTLYVRAPDGKTVHLLDALGVASLQRASLGDPFTHRAIGMSGVYAPSGPTGNAYDAIRAALDPMALTKWRREQTAGALLEAVTVQS